MNWTSFGVSTPESFQWVSHRLRILMFNLFISCFTFSRCPLWQCSDIPGGYLDDILLGMDSSRMTIRFHLSHVTILTGWGVPSISNGNPFMSLWFSVELFMTMVFLTKDEGSSLPLLSPWYFYQDTISSWIALTLIEFLSLLTGLGFSPAEKPATLLTGLQRP